MAIVDRPFAVIGRSPTVDLPVPSAGASLRHVYLHLDPRGVFAVDLASRSGTRFDGAPDGSGAAWIRPGRGLEVAGYRVELLEASVADPLAPQGANADAFSYAGAAAGRPDPLAEAAGLALLELAPEDEPDRPWRMLSELSFLGRGRHCAVRAEGAGVARVHAVLVRSASGAFVVDLAGPGLTINGERPAAAVPLRDGDRLSLGHSRFVVRLLPHCGAAVPAVARADVPAPAEPGEALANRVLRAVRDGRADPSRPSDPFQQALVATIRQLYLEQAALFDSHLERLDRLQNEVAELRAEIRRRLDPAPTPVPPAGRASPAAIDEPPAPPPIEVPPPAPALEPGHATSWLLDRVRELEGQVEQETRSGWRALLPRIGTPLRVREDA